MGEIKSIPELRAKFDGCTTSKEVLELAAAEGIELTEEQLKMVSGGAVWDNDSVEGCPNCGSKKWGQSGKPRIYQCYDCLYEWNMWD